MLNLSIIISFHRVDGIIAQAAAAAAAVVVALSV